MKNYTYKGDQASLSIRVKKGKSIVFLKGVPTPVSDDIHSELKDHKIFKSLIDAGHLVIEGVAVERPKEVASDYSKMTMPELKSALTAKNIFFEPDSKKADLLDLLLKEQG